MKYHILALLGMWLLLCISCSPKEGVSAPSASEGNEYMPYPVPRGFTPMDVPADNQPTLNRVKLGQALFFDPILSLDSTKSCGSCHKPEIAFADNASKSLGVGGALGERNAPSLANIGFHSSFFWDGGVARLEQVAVAPLENPLELNLNHSLAAGRLNASARYRTAFQNAYGAEASLSTISKALAAFMRTMISAGSRVDAFEAGDSTSLTATEKLGRALFLSDSLACSQCHQPPLYTNLSFQNTGLYEQYTDLGRRRVTVGIQDDGKFKVPTLRNVALTAPYMHDGSMNTLTQVLQHYSSGGKNHPRKSRLLKGFSLTNTQTEALIKFLEALNDPSFTHNPSLQPLR